MGALKFIVLEPRIVFDASLTGGLGTDLRDETNVSEDDAYALMKKSIQSLEALDPQKLPDSPDGLSE